MATFTYGAWSRYDDGTWKNNTTGAIATPEQVPVLENWSGWNKTAENQTLADQHFAQQQQATEGALASVPQTGATFTYGAWSRYDDGTWKNNTTGAIATPDQIPVLENWSGYNKTADNQSLADQHFAQQQEAITGALSAPQMGTLSMDAPANSFAPALGPTVTGSAPWEPGQPLRGAQLASSFATNPADLVASLMQPQTTIIDENNNTQTTPAHTFNEQGILMAPPQRDPNWSPETGLPEYMPARPYVFKLANGNGGVLGSDGTVADTGMTFNEADNGSLRDPLQFAAMAAAAYFGAQGLGNLAGGAQLPMDAGIDFGPVTSPATTGALPSAADQAIAEGFRAGELAGQAPGSTQVAGAIQSPQLPLDYGVNFGPVTQPTAPLSNILGGAPAATPETGALSNITTNPALAAGTPTGTAAATGGLGLNPTTAAIAAGTAAVPGLGGDQGTGLTPPAGALGETLPNVNTGPTTYPPDVTVNPNLNPENVTVPTPGLPNIATLPTTPNIPNPTITTPGALPTDDELPPLVEEPPSDDELPPLVEEPPSDDVTLPPDDNITPPPDDPSLGDPPDGADPGLVEYIKKFGKEVLTSLGFMKDGKIDWGKALAAGGLLAGLYQGSKPATSSVKQELPEWYTRGSQEALALAKQYADKGFEPYTGEAIAPLSANENAAIEMAKNSAGVWEPVAKQGADLVAKGALPVSQSDIRGYVNPAMADFFGGGQPPYPSYGNDNQVGDGGWQPPYPSYGNDNQVGDGGALPAPSEQYYPPPSGTVPAWRAQNTPGVSGYVRDVPSAPSPTGALPPSRTPSVASMYDEAGNLIRAGTSAITQDDLSRLMNPYIELAYAPAKRQLERDTAAKQAIARASAVSRGAFGTDRQAIQDSLLNEAGLTALGDLYGTSYKTAFDEATKLATGEKDRSLTGGNTMYGAANNLGSLTNTAWKNATDTATGNLDRMIKGGGALSDIATEGSNLTDADIKRLGATGALDRSVRQAKNDFDYGQYQDRLKFPSTAIGNYATALRGVPGNTTTKTDAPPNFLGETLGALGAWFNLPKTKEVG